MQTRKEYVNWAKERAIKELETGDIGTAWASLVSDLTNDPRTSDHGAIPLGNLMVFGGQITTKQQMKEFIEGTN